MSGATTFLLIRHAAHDYLGRAIAGRKAGIHINPSGREQAEQLARSLAGLPIDAVYSGPLERVRETAEPLCRALKLSLQTDSAFDEFDVGEWTDRTFADLDQAAAWQRFNSFRACTPAPGGELMIEVQVRVVRRLCDLRSRHECVAVVTHGDVIRAALTHFLGMHISLYAQIEIDAPSISIVEFGEELARVRLVNAPITREPLELPWLSGS
ncbi:MAG: histidine phosphatase family protein [Chthoniobacterales bacterium]